MPLHDNESLAVPTNKRSNMVCVPVLFLVSPQSEGSFGMSPSFPALTGRFRLSEDAIRRLKPSLLQWGSLSIQRLLLGAGNRFFGQEYACS